MMPLYGLVMKMMPILWPCHENDATIWPCHENDATYTSYSLVMKMMLALWPCDENDASLWPCHENETTLWPGHENDANFMALSWQWCYFMASSWQWCFDVWERFTLSAQQSLTVSQQRRQWIVVLLRTSTLLRITATTGTQLLHNLQSLSVTWSPLAGI